MYYVSDFETTTVEPAKIWAVGMCEIENIDNFVHFNKFFSFILCIFTNFYFDFPNLHFLFPHYNV